MIFLNLFLAILLENFDEDVEEKPEQQSLLAKEEQAITFKTVSLKIKNKCSMYCLKCRRCFGAKNKNKNDNKNNKKQEE